MLHKGFPDVSAQSINFYIQWTGGWYTVNGTSASTPGVASIFALLDDELVAAGQPPLGWLNPLIYANPQAFNDILNGLSFLLSFKMSFGANERAVTDLSMMCCGVGTNPGCGTDGFSAG